MRRSVLGFYKMEGSLTAMFFFFFVYSDEFDYENDKHNEEEKQTEMKG